MKLKNCKNKYTLKAGCILVDEYNKKIGLIYRDLYSDYEFPKGHLETDESLSECAVRETAEETKRTAEIVSSLKPLTETYTTPKGEKCKCVFYIATDKGKSNNTSTDTHELVWIDFDKVEEKLSYDSLKSIWKKAKSQIKKYYNF